ncbi:MAG: M81 family metallopeptidase [Thermomicrobiales bacterium]
MRVLFGGFAHETNTFSPWKTGVAEFRANGYYVGDEIRTLAGTNTGAAGVLRAAAAEPDVELILTVQTTAIPGGYVTDEVFEEVVGAIEAAILKESPDAIVLDLHGAMVTESEVDGDGAILRRIRSAAGPAVPIVAELDLHANVGVEMLQNATILVPYDTYPHIDNAERGEEIFRLAVDAARGKTSPVMASRRLPMFLAGPKQFSGTEPTKSIMALVHEIERRPGVLTAGVCFAFPWADCPFAGMTVTVATDGDEALARQLVNEISEVICSRREEFRPETMTVEEAVHAAMQTSEGPVVLADLGDNPGGGSAADGTALLWGLLDLGAKNVGFALIADPEVVDQAFAAGLGRRIQVRLGAKADKLHGYPLDVTATITNLTDGGYVYEGPMLTGVRGSLGRTAVLACEGRHGNIVEVIVCERRVQPLDTAVFRSQGINPEEKQILVVKSAVHFRGAYMPIAKRIIEVDTPGLTSVDFARFPYAQLNRPIWPLDAIPDSMCQTDPD